MAQRPQNDSPSTKLDASSPGHSQPMTTSNSEGPDAPTKDASAEASSASSPYGTRSRHRSGNSRPNYAEDKEMDFEYDYNPSKKDSEPKKSTRLAQTPALTGSETQRPNGPSRRTTSDDSKITSSHHGANDEISTSQQAPTQVGNGSGGSQPASKKRKAAAHSRNSTPAPQPSQQQGSATTKKSASSQSQAQISGRTFSETNMLTFADCNAMPKDGKLVADDGTVLAPNDYVYLVCEPPGEPYYIGRIMEFLHHGNDTTKPVDALRINWFYRPKDIGRRVQDTRLLFATMHSDISPLTALRGKCDIRHRSEIKSLDEFRKTPDCFCNESVDCSDCKLTYHMNCVSPPVTKKPSRGFGWSCAACSRRHEQKLHARNIPNALHDVEFDDDELNDEEEVADTTQPATPNGDTSEDQHMQGTAEQVHQASLWPYRYLGQHCKVEDALDYDDRIYPRASSRIGPRHQATVVPWAGRPVKYEPVIEFKRSKKDSKLSKESQAALEAQKIRRETRPKWIQDEPPGYTVRGEDHDEKDSNCTSTLLWKPPPSGTLPDEVLKKYTERALAMAPKLGVPDNSTNLQNIALTTLYANGFDTEKALDVLSKTGIEAFKEPNFTAAEQKKFEEAVVKHGSELHSVTKHMKTRKHGDIVRHYYIWKKTDRGKQIWGDYSGRKGRKEAKKAEEAALKLEEDLADTRDDSAYDYGKAVEKKKNFICKFCSTKSSRQWRRAPASAGAEAGTGKGSSKDKKDQPVVALCRRCAELWRRYGIQWEDVEEMAKKVAQAGGRAWKRKQDEELLKELIAAKDLPSLSPPASDSRASPANGTPVSAAQNGEPPRKKLKSAPDDRSGQDSALNVSKRKEKAVEKQASTPPVVIPEPRTLPCAICNELEPLGDQHLSCRECRLAVHRNCYGVVDSRALSKPEKWMCDTCTNDRSPQVSIDYKCVLCPVEHTAHDFVCLPKSTSHKKKTDRDRDREKIEREQAQNVADFYRKKQEESNRPVNPREALKRTADNNWVHVTCAVWTPEVRFGSVHVECARQNGYVLGFDITPIKGSRRDQFNIVTINGESGAMSAALWCKEHVPTKTIVHRMNDIVDENGLNALQLYVQNFKQADRSITDTVRKANMVTAAAKSVGTGLRRPSTVAITNGTWWSVDDEGKELANGYHHEFGTEAQKFAAESLSAISTGAGTTSP
ncbi:related to PHD finger protein [Cephalotrichum gorgonifer]|uniref:Related to PHD finger protein n=1 Tax=Cephalotrichum gorgonifer TaxID=2041049 RepID=A0AAE8MQ98_9PEZI|nr:related to PHD finger protein [Cephalotrichum gorgonifer]